MFRPIFSSSFEWITPRRQTLLNWVSDSDIAFQYMTKPIKHGKAASLLVLLHDTGQSESQVAVMAPHVTDGVVVVMPRGGVKVGAGYAWCLPELTASGQRARMRTCTHEMLDFLSSLQAKFDLDAQRTVIAGFGQGGTLAASVFNSARSVARGIGMLGCRLPADTATPRSEHDQAGRCAFVGHGLMDDIYPIDRADEATLWFARQNIRYDQRRYLAKHELSPQMRDDFVRWFNRDWLDTIPLLSPLATSRCPLSLPGE